MFRFIALAIIALSFMLTTVEAQTNFSMSQGKAICIAGIAANRKYVNWDATKEYCDGMEVPQAICVTGIVKAKSDISWDNTKSYCAGLTEAEATCIAGVVQQGNTNWDATKKYCRE